MMRVNLISSRQMLNLKDFIGVYKKNNTNLQQINQILKVKK
jgi:hypothetical protein